MARKSNQKTVGFPDDLLEKIESVAKWLADEGYQSRENFSEAVLYILRSADKLGLLNPPYGSPAEPAKPKKK
jgi:hypothetical protein